LGYQRANKAANGARHAIAHSHDGREVSINSSHGPAQQRADQQDELQIGHESGLLLWQCRSNPQSAARLKAMLALIK
jgi:hypothetical protein